MVDQVKVVADDQPAEQSPPAQPAVTDMAQRGFTCLVLLVRVVYGVRQNALAFAALSIIFACVIPWFMLFFVMRAMGELLLSNLEYKSFSDFASDLPGPWAGYFTGWTYWFCWVVTGMADVVAI